MKYRVIQSINNFKHSHINDIKKMFTFDLGDHLLVQKIYNEVDKKYTEPVKCIMHRDYGKFIRLRICPEDRDEYIKDVLKVDIYTKRYVFRDMNGKQIQFSREFMGRDNENMSLET